MKTFSEIFDKFPVADLASLLGVAESHVRTMKARNSIPPEHWGPILEAAPHYDLGGLSYHALKSMRRERFTANERGAAA